MRIRAVNFTLLIVCALVVPAAPARAQAASSASLIPDDVPTPKHTGVRALFRNLGNDFKALPSMPKVPAVVWHGDLRQPVADAR